MNKVILLGRLTRDPEIKYLGSSQVAVASFTLAVNRKFKSKDGTRKADFIRIEAWDKKAELCYQYLKKGSQVSVEGSISIDIYSTETGESKSITKIRLSELDFISSGTKSNEYNNKQRVYEGKELFEDHEISVDISDEDIPF